MKKLFFVLVVMLLVSAFIVSGCATASTSTTAPATTSQVPATSSAPAKVITLKFAYDMPAKGVIVPGWTWWANQVEQQSNGRVKIDFYPAGALFDQQDTPDSLKADVADIANISLTAHTDLEPITNVFGLPGMEFPDNTLQGYMDKYDAYLKLSQKYPAISNELSDYKLLMWVPNPSYLLITKKQVIVPSDLKGMKIGCSAIQGQVIQLAGGTPVQMIPPNMYENISKGVVDGGLVSWSHVSVYKLTEVANYFLDRGFTQESTQICMNLQKWNSLPPDIQKIMMDNVRESISRSCQAFLSGNQNGINLVKDSNKTITTLTPDQSKQWDNVETPIQEAWSKDAQSKGVSNAANILSDLKALRDSAMSASQ